MRDGQGWQVHSKGTWVATRGTLKLAVMQGERWARFLVSKTEAGVDSVSEILVRSGNREDVGAAMAAAEFEARRLQSLPPMLTLEIC